MTEVFVIRNQLGHYWAKRKTWADGRAPRTLYRARHEDEAVNTLFELGIKDIELRGEIMAVELSKKREPIIEQISDIPVPNVDSGQGEMALKTDDAPAPEADTQSAADASAAGPDTDTNPETPPTGG